MEKEDVNELILDKVDEIEDSHIRQFIDDILRFERSELDKAQPHYKTDYKTYLETHIEGWNGFDSNE